MTTADSALHCSDCGGVLASDDRFCGVCGARADDTASANQGRSPADAVSPSEQRSRRWRQLHSLWMLWLLTLGFFSFIGVLYVGLRVMRQRWILAGVLYAIAPVIFFASPQGSTMQNVAGFACLAVGVISAVHAFRLRREYLDIRSADAAHTPRPRPAASRRWERRAAQARMADPLTAAAATLKDKISGYRGGVDAAERALRDTAKKAGRAAKNADKEVVKQSAERKLAGSLTFPVTLFEESVKLPGGSRLLSEQTDATVDTAGNLMTTRRWTLTRFALLGPLSLFAPKKTHDDKRELYLLVEDPGWAEVVKLKPDHGQQARTMAQQIKLAANNLATAKTQRAARTKASQVRAAQVRAEGAAAVADARQGARAACLRTDALSAARDAVAKLSPRSDTSRAAKRAAGLLDEADELLARAAAKAAAYEDHSDTSPPEPPAPTSSGDDPAPAAPGGDSSPPSRPEAADAADGGTNSEPVSAATAQEPAAEDATDRLPHAESGDPASQDLLSAIAGLAELHRQGILSDAEFETKKAELLDRL